MKKIFITFILVLLLSSCFGSSDTIPDESSSDLKKGLEIYSTGSFTVAIPNAWKKYSSQDSIIPKPIFGDIVLATVSEKEKLGFYNNFVVISQKLGTNITSLEYSILNNALSTKDYLEYEEIKQKNISFPNATKSKLYIFKARYNERSAKAVFIQAGEVCGDIGYLLTIGLNQNVEDTGKYEKIIETFTCKKVEEK